MLEGDEIEIFGPAPGFVKQKISEMYDFTTGERLTSAPHPKQLLKMKMENPGFRELYSEEKDKGVNQCYQTPAIYQLQPSS